MLVGPSRAAESGTAQTPQNSAGAGMQVSVHTAGRVGAACGGCGWAAGRAFIEVAAGCCRGLSSLDQPSPTTILIPWMYCVVMLGFWRATDHG